MTFWLRIIFALNFFLMIEWLRIKIKIKINFMWIFFSINYEAFFVVRWNQFFNQLAFIVCALLFSSTANASRTVNFLFVLIYVFRIYYIHYYVRNVHRLDKSLKNIGIHRKMKRVNHKRNEQHLMWWDRPL